MNKEDLEIVNSVAKIADRHGCCLCTQRGEQLTKEELLVVLNDEFKKLNSDFTYERLFNFAGWILYGCINKSLFKTYCAKCKGSGLYLYADTGIWKGKGGGRMKTTSVCDLCWGSKDSSNPGKNLKEAWIKEIK